jgi:hypothetical protein
MGKQSNSDVARHSVRNGNNGSVVLYYRCRSIHAVSHR